jgi:phage-related tail fiber protein
MIFQTIHTTHGLTAMAQAEATGTPINLTHMAVGDGNGNPVAPTEGQTNLVRELFRAAPNRIYQDPTTPNRFTAELVIPASTGGFVLREVGVFDANGSLFVVGNLPDTYKPQASEGAYADTVVRVDFFVTNASIVTIQIDPNVAVATQEWISNNITACTLLPGGTTGQVLRKKSNTCGDTEWANPTDVNVTVNTVEEIQTLADSQTVVNWVTVTGVGLAVYVEGVRLRSDQWTQHPTINTRITLAQAYPDGTKIVGAQNEPASELGDPLQQDQNLADVPDKAVARTNLDVFSKAETRQMAPAGQVAYFGRSTAPTGWLKANGAQVSRTAYADLFAAIGTTFGTGDGFNTFNLPDLRGEFLRGWDDGRGVDSGRAIGSAQNDEFKSHTHATSPAGTLLGNNGSGTRLTSGTGTLVNYETGLATTGGAETRPRNVALLACIKF